MSLNSIGREIPDQVRSSRPLYQGPWARIPGAGEAGTGAEQTNTGAGQIPGGTRYAPPLRGIGPRDTKILPSLREAILAAGLRDGMTISFHHHLRNGDHVLNMVMEIIAGMGIRDLTLAPSSIFPVHAPLVEHIRSGVVTGLESNYALGPVAEAVSRGELARPMILRTHGGRVRAIEAGELRIDVAFVAAPAADPYGNVNGVYGPSACGSLGYAAADAQYARYLIAVTDNLMPYPLRPVSIPQTQVDAVVVVDRLGEPKDIVSGSTRITRDPVGLLIARSAAEVIDGAGLIKEGMSFQTGAGGTSLAVAAFVRRYMEERKITASFGMGGTTGYFVEMLRDGLLRSLLDTQCFDLAAVESLRDDPRHVEVDCGYYANPWNKGAVVNLLDTVVLGATEVDTDFNVNVATSSNGIIMGGSGGHADTAAGARLSIIVTTTRRTRLPIIRDRVTTVTTPGETVDVVVTETGIAVNPRREDLVARLKERGLPVVPIDLMRRRIEDLTGKPAPAAVTDRVVALVEYRDGSLLDVVYQVD